MKLSRRSFCACLAGAAPLIASSALAQPAAAQSDSCAVFTPKRQSDTTPERALELLREGNRRFVDGHTIHCDLKAQARQVAEHQSPFAAIVGCIDSRVPPEMIFDQHIGDIFCARVAGNFVNDDILGSLEYATKVAGAKAIVVLGHTHCGAIKSAVAGVKMGKITGMLANLEPALSVLTDADGPRDPSNHAQLDKVTQANVHHTVEAITQRSDILRALVEAGELRVVGAVDDVATGEVTWLS